MKLSTLLKQFGPLLAVILLFSLSVCGDNSFETEESDQPGTVRIPRIDAPSYFDATDEYIGVISDDKHRFQLFDLQGNVVFSERVEPGGFFMVEMRDYNGFFILGRAETEDLAMYTVYDYSGRKLLDMWCQGVLKAFPSGLHYFSENGNTYMEVSPGAPTIYDSQGDVLAEFSVGTDLWEMTAVNDSLLVLEHYDRVQLISVPTMTVISEIDLDGLHPTGLSMRRSLSPDGTHYAYLAAREIVVCDLYNESAILVPLDFHGEIPSTPVIFLSENADYLLTHDNPLRTQTLDVFKKEDGTYVKMVDDFTIPMDGGGLTPIKGTFISDHIFAASFARSTSTGIQPRTFLYRFDTAEAVASGLAVEGFIWINPQSPDRINRLIIDSDAGTASVSEFSLEGM